MNILPRLLPYLTVFAAILLLGFMLLVVVPMIQASYDELSTNPNINNPLKANSVITPVWSAHVKSDVSCSSIEAITCTTEYPVTINEGDAIRKSVHINSKEKLVSLITYYHVNYNLNLISITSYYQRFDLTYQQFIEQEWGNQEPTMKYNASEFAPEYTPVPTPAPTFSASKWYKETIV
jgi:hypothetical protein